MNTWEMNELTIKMLDEKISTLLNEICNEYRVYDNVDEYSLNHRDLSYNPILNRANKSGFNTVAVMIPQTEVRKNETIAEKRKKVANLEAHRDSLIEAQSIAPPAVEMTA